MKTNLNFHLCNIDSFIYLHAWLWREPEEEVYPHLLEILWIIGTWDFGGTFFSSRTLQLL